MGLEKEILTIYSEANRPIGTENREDIIKKGLLVEGVQLWIINPDTNQVLMQKRSRNKKNNPGKIDVSVSGHVKSTETPTQAILREASEEIGIKDRQLLYSKLQKIAQTQIDLRKFGRQGNYIMTFWRVLWPMLMLGRGGFFCRMMRRWNRIKEEHISMTQLLIE